MHQFLFKRLTKAFLFGSSSILVADLLREAFVLERAFLQEIACFDMGGLLLLE